MHRDHKVVLTVFAGRRDRMALLLKHTDRLIADGLLDEVHLWDYCRARDDRAWLHSLPSTPLVAHEHTYGPPEAVSESTYAFRVHGAASDVHVLLVTPDGTEYELVLGGWSNTRSVLRRGRQGEELARNETIRLDTKGWTDVALAWVDGELRVQVGTKNWVAPFEDAVASIRHAAWDHPVVYDRPAAYRLALPHTPTKWNSYYRHYHAFADTLYANTILIKCDDDMVHLGSSEAFRAFLDFRLDHPEYSLVFPNIINNGAAAFLQKQHHGLLQNVDLEDTMPTTCGRLWESGHRARQVHDEFLANPAAFAYDGHHEIPARHRVSINMFAVLPSTLATRRFGTAGDDDEAALTENEGVKAIFNGFTAAHLSFYSQERSVGSKDLLGTYAALADPTVPAAPTPPRPVRRPRLLKKVVEPVAEPTEAVAGEPAPLEAVAEVAAEEPAAEADVQEHVEEPVQEPVAAVAVQEPVAAVAVQEPVAAVAAEEPVQEPAPTEAVAEAAAEEPAAEEPVAGVAAGVAAAVAAEPSVAEPAPVKKRRGRAPKKTVAVI